MWHQKPCSILALFFFIGVSLSAQDNQKRLLFPWISNSETFESVLVVNNYGETPVTVTLTARRENGDQATAAELAIPARGFLKRNASSLFPELGNGPGYAVLLESSGGEVSGRWVTHNLTAETGRSPSQGVAVDLPEDPSTEQRLGSHLLFGFLPLSDGFTSAPVVVNTGSQPTNVSLSYFDEAGNLIHRDDSSLRDLEPNRPFARVANGLVPAGSGDVYLVASSDAEPITGVVFVFNGQGETAIGNASAFDPENPAVRSELLYAWVSNAESFESLVIANNLGDGPADVSLRALRANGESETVQRTIAAHGFLKEKASDLFPQMGAGSGYSVKLEADAGLIRGRWVTSNLAAASGRSPSQGVAVDLTATHQSRSGESINFGFLPVTGGSVSAPVVVNIGDQNSDVTLYFYNESGRLVAIDKETLADLPPYRPFATVANQFVAESTEDLTLLARTEAGRLTGVAFIFNSGNEPAIGNVSGVAFNPPLQAEATAAPLLENGPDFGFVVSFPRAEHEQRIAAYRVVVVKGEQAAAFDLAAAAQLDPERYTSLAPNGMDHRLSLTTATLDSAGEPLQNGVDYVVFVFTRVSGPFDSLDALSPASNIRGISAPPGVGTLAAGFMTGGGLTIDNDGNLYSAEWGVSLQNGNGTQVWKITPDGTATVYATGFNTPSGNAIDAQGNLFQSNIATGVISKITPQGVKTAYSSGHRSPVGIAVDENGNLFVCNCGAQNIRRVGPSGGTSFVFAQSTLFNCPNGITFDEENNLFVSNFNNGSVLKILPDGTVSLFATIPGGGNGHLSYFNGRLFVASLQGNRVYQVDLAGGSVSLLAGKGTPAVADGDLTDASFFHPNGVAASPDGSIIYTNGWGRAVRKITLPPRAETTVPVSKSP